MTEPVPAIDPRYPNGKFDRVLATNQAERNAMIDRIAVAPSNLKAAVAGLNESQLDTPYREGGWTPRQVVHHIADSHMNAFIRFKLGLTESTPTIKVYDEKLWAELSDGKSVPVDASLRLVDGLHERWVTLLRSMAEPDFAKKIVHPVAGENPLDFFLALYSWHGAHHTAQITNLRKQKGW